MAELGFRKMKREPKIIVVTGPTSSGKTEAAIKIAGALKTEIVSVDSRQVYRELPIGSGAADNAQLAEITHHLVGTHSLAENLNAASYSELARASIADILQRRGVAVVAGGATLYMDVLLNGISPMPAVDDATRMHVNSEFEEKGIQWLQQELLFLDPEYYFSSDHKNPARLKRALEVIMASGEKYSSFRRGPSGSLAFDHIQISIEPSREELYRRINARCAEMLKDGLLEEAANLIEYREFPVLKTIGYQQAFEYFDGKLTAGEMLEKFSQHTRNYAKRQMTWLRRNEARVAVETIPEAASSALRAFGL